MNNKHDFDTQDENDSIRESIRRIAILLSKTPTQKEYKDHFHNDEMSLEQILYRFGKWSEAVEFAGLEPNPFRQPPTAPEITKKELVEEFISVSNEIGAIPSTNVFRSKSKYSWTPYKTKWGSWRNAVESIIEDFPSRFMFPVESTRRKRSKSERRALRIDLPLIYEPSNEMETVVLFSLLADQFACRLDTVRSEFPDAIVEHEEKELQIEFEYLSSNYIQHCHPMDFEGIVICWREDVKLNGIKVISLEKVIREMAQQGTGMNACYTTLHNHISARL